MANIKSCKRRILHFLFLQRLTCAQDCNLHTLTQTHTHTHIHTHTYTHTRTHTHTHTHTHTQTYTHIHTRRERNVQAHGYLLNIADLPKQVAVIKL